MAVSLMAALAAALFLLMSDQSRQAAAEAAQYRQMASLRLLLDKFSDAYPELEIESSNGVPTRVTWPGVTAPDTHDLIDEVGRIAGEVATLFGWDAAAGEFVRLSTTVVGPDGSRGVGTFLGAENPVHAAMLRGETFRGEAVILGQPYLAIYEPILDAAGETVGIFAVAIERSSIDRHSEKMRREALILVSVLLAIGAVVAVLGTRRMLRPLGQLEGTIMQIADGGLDAEVPHVGRSDQIGSIARSVADFRDRLARAAEGESERRIAQEEQAVVVDQLRMGLSALSRRDLGYRISKDVFPGSYDALRQDFNAAAQNLSAAMADLAAIASRLNSGSHKVGGLASDLSRRVETQAAALEETAAALDELAGGGRQISQRVTEANGLAKSGTDLSRDSSARLEEAMSAMTRIETASEEIDKIVSLIEDIAFQTNLLALNAGVEAARAGEAGKGFAVVATEVRSLAARASESVGEIRALIQKNVDEVSEGSRLVRQTGTSIGAVLDQVFSLGTLVSEIETEVASQARGLSEINNGMRLIETATQENAALANQAHDAGDQMSRDTAQLHQTVAEFRLSDEEQADAAWFGASTGLQASGQSRRA
ncbi:MAG: methyl-accepting chemotaxis protein [Rhodobacteraceae bacterium]|nr:MAG: methyl-accepting chemotaxis protein [Paracoccaceae bacterium]